MSEQAISAILGSSSSMLPAQAMGGAPGGQNPAAPGLPGGFAQILHNQNAASAVLETLRPVLPAETFSQLQLQVAGGNLLPLAEIVAAIATPQRMVNAGGTDPALQQPAMAQPLAQIVAALHSNQSTQKYVVVSEGGAEVGEAVGEEAGEEVGEEMALPLSEIASALHLQFQPVAPEIDPGQEKLHPFAEMAVAQALTKLRDSSASSTAISAVLHTNKASSDGEGAKLMGQNQTVPEFAADLDFDATAESADEAMRRNLASEQSKSMGTAVTGQGANPASATAALRAVAGGLETTGIQVNPSAAGATALSAGQPPLNPGLEQPGKMASAAPPPLDLPLGHKGWAQAMGERVLWMVGNRLQGAEIRITPPHLGPIDIRLSINNDQASVSFAAHHGVVREALEAGIPRLREMLGESNLQLVNVDVGHRDANQQRMPSDFFGQKQFSSNAEGWFGETGELEVADEKVRYYRQDGLVDDFA
jgi:flagellar hook-length control protein FliK